MSTAVGRYHRREARGGWSPSRVARVRDVLGYPPLEVAVITPKLELPGATDGLLAELVPVVRSGKAAADPPPYDDPMSLYEPDPARRVARWLQAVWRGRGMARPDSWRLQFAVIVEGHAVGMQDIIGDHFAEFGTVATFSWLSSDARRRGIGREMRHAALHLAFRGLGATEASSDAFIDNTGSNGVSRALGYAANGVEWSTRQGQPAQLQRWRLTREAWQEQERDDITLIGAAECRAVLSG